MSYYLVSYDSKGNPVRYKFDKHIANQCVLIQTIQPDENDEINTVITYSKEEIETTIRFLEYFYGLNNILQILKNVRDFDDRETIENLIKTFNKLFKLTFNQSWYEYFNGITKLDNPFLQWLAFDLDDYPDIKYFVTQKKIPPGRLSLLFDIKSSDYPMLKNLINIEDIDLFNKFRPFQPFEEAIIGKPTMINQILIKCSPEITLEVIRRYPELINNPDASERFIKHINIFYRNFKTDEICNALLNNINWAHIIPIYADFNLFRRKLISRFIEVSYKKSKGTNDIDIIDFQKYLGTFRVLFRKYFEHNHEHFDIINFQIDDFLVNRHKIPQEEPIYTIIRNTILNL